MENVAHALAHVPSEYRTAAELKFSILTRGLKVTSNANAALFESTARAKKPIRTRSGVSGGLDLRLARDIFVNAPISESFAQHSPFVLDFLDDRLCIRQNDQTLCTADAIPEPTFYGLTTRDWSERMSRIAQMCSPDRLCFGMTGPGCSFWRPAQRCRYCSIGLNAPSDASGKKEEQFYEVLEAAIAEATWPACHVLIGGGTPASEDMGAMTAARLCIEIKRRFGVSVYVMIVAPLKDDYLDMLHDAGVDEIGLNLEFWSDAAWDAYIPGKRDRISKLRYLLALEHAAGLFGPVRTRSILIAGLESPENTLQGVTKLCELGVMPILSPFRPLSNTPLVGAPLFSEKQYAALYGEALKIAARFDLPLGPTCICCQNNTLALPFGRHYKWYNE